MANIMDYKIFVYLFFGLLSAYALYGMNFETLVKKNRLIEARLLFLLLTLALGYLSGSFFLIFFMK